MPYSNLTQIKDYLKKESIKQIVDSIFSEGMTFMAQETYKEEDAKEYKNLMINEIKRRLKRIKNN